jgi:hypothetical protein
VKDSGAGERVRFPCPRGVASEEQAQRELQVAHVAGLAGDLSEGGKVGRVEVGVAPVRVVEESNASARNCKPVFSVKENFLKRPTFQFSKPGLWITFRKPAGCVLKVLRGGLE